MKLIEIQELLKAIEQSELEEVSIETESIKLHAKKRTVAFNSAALVSHAHAIQANSLIDAHTIVKQEDTIDQTGNYVMVKSPMVGTFRRALSQHDVPFVQKGDRIVPGTKLCIIEAMKLDNEIESEISGEIVDILVEDISPVAYDQPLFLVNPDA